MDKYTDRCTDANQLYNVSHALCYSYGADKNYSYELCKLQFLVTL